MTKLDMEIARRFARRKRYASSSNYSSTLEK